MSKVGPLTWYLGMSNEYTKGVQLRISQRSYLKGLLKRFNMEEASIKDAKDTPMAAAFKISTADCPEVVNDRLRSEYCMMVVGMMYAACATRGDISNAGSQLAKAMANPGEVNLTAAKRALRFIKIALDKGIVYSLKEWIPPGETESVSAATLVSYSDSD